MQHTMQLQTCSCYHAECHTVSSMQLLPCRMPHSFTIQLLPCRLYLTVTLGLSPLSITMHCHAIMQHHHAIVTVVQSQHATCNIRSITMGILPWSCHAGTPCNFPHSFPLELLPVTSRHNLVASLLGTSVLHVRTGCINSCNLATADSYANLWIILKVIL